MRKILKYIIIFLLLILIFNLLLFITSLFPSSWIEKNVKESSQILLNEGNDYVFFEEYYVKNNNYTDALMINEAYSIDNQNPIYSYMSARKNYKEGKTKQTSTDTSGEGISIDSEEYDPVGELDAFLKGDIDKSVTYARYWHGYLPVLRVLLIFFNISEMRTILLIVFMILFIYLMCLLRKKLGIKIMLIYGFSLIVEDYFFVSYSLESAPVFITMMLACIILLKNIDKMEKEKLYQYIFIISCITNFVDYLTVPLITLAMPLYIYILYNQKQKKQESCKEYLKLIIKSTIIWFLGYAITWISKWVIYDIIYNEQLIKLAIDQAMYRTSATNPYRNITIGKQILMLSIESIMYFAILINIEMIIIVINIYKNKIIIKQKSIYIAENIPILIISLMPFVWYITLSNHTILHAKFVYRHMLIFLIGIILLTTNLLVAKDKKISGKP